MAAAAPAAARETRAELARSGWDAPVLERIVEIVDERARWLADAAGAPAGRSWTREES